MPFCPQCKFEYTSGEAECIDCGVPLVDELEVSTDPEPEDEDTTFTPLRNYSDRVQAEVVKEALANEGIPSRIKADDSLGFANSGIGAHPEVVLWVPEDSQEFAERIADRLRRPEV